MAPTKEGQTALEKVVRAPPPAPVQVSAEVRARLLQGLPPLYRIAMAAVNGSDGLPRDVRSGFALVKALADHGYPSAINSMAYVHMRGEPEASLPRDADMAFGYFEALSKLLPGRDADMTESVLGSAFHEMSVILPYTTRGRGMTAKERDVEVVAFMERGAELNCASALHNLACGLVEGWNGLAINHARAIELETRASLQNNTSGKIALVNLAQWHRHGRYGLPRSWTTAEQMLLRAGTAESFHSLGVSYDPYFSREGSGADKRDYDRAFAFYEQAWKLGSRHSLANMIDFVENGYGSIQPDPRRLVELNLQALQVGLDVKRQLERVVATLNVAVQFDTIADQPMLRSPFGQFRLASMLEDGFAVDQSRAKARKWYTRATAGGYEPAKEALTRMGNPTPEEEAEEAAARGLSADSGSGSSNGAASANQPGAGSSSSSKNGGSKADSLKK